jgi:hypothetical protein
VERIEPEYVPGHRIRQELQEDLRIEYETDDSKQSAAGPRADQEANGCRAQPRQRQVRPGKVVQGLALLDQMELDQIEVRQDPGNKAEHQGTPRKDVADRRRVETARAQQVSGRQ